jgi:hypothetical protein
VLAPLRSALPPDEKLVGVITFDDPETSLWRPFGSRKILHVAPDDTGEQIRRWGVRYVLVSANRYNQIQPVFPETL